MQWEKISPNVNLLHTVCSEMRYQKPEAYGTQPCFPEGSTVIVLKTKITKTFIGKHKFLPILDSLNHFCFVFLARKRNRIMVLLGLKINSREQATRLPSPNTPKRTQTAAAQATTSLPTAHILC